LIPRNILASPYPEGNTVNLSWKSNNIDTKEYELNSKTTGDWFILKIITHPSSTFNHTDLVDGMQYSYRLRAKDYKNQYSEYSPVTTCTPSDTVPPTPPTDLKATAVSNSEIKLSWSDSAAKDVTGYIIFMNDTGEDHQGTFHKIGLVNSSTTTFTATDLGEKIEYYFKLRAIDEVPNNSSFSDTASAETPDETPPLSPKGFGIKSLSHDRVTLNWSTNTEIDISGYNIYRSMFEDVKFTKINSETIIDLEFTDSNLQEAEDYFYKLTALDLTGLESNFSKTVMVRTYYAPAPPEVYNPISYIVIEEDSLDESINLKFMFKDLNDDPLNFSATGQKHINVIINHETGDVVLLPDQDWHGEETLTFHADDGMFNTSAEIFVTVSSINDPPGNAVILSPTDGDKFKEGKKLNFTAECEDPDLPGDLLTFSWYSNISSLLGTGKSLTEVELTPGRHKITLIVRDLYDESTITSITITIEHKPKSEKDKLEDKEDNKEDKNMMIYAGVAVGAAVIVTIFVIIFLMMRRRKAMEAEESKILTGSIGGTIFPRLEECMLEDQGSIQQPFYPQQIEEKTQNQHSQVEIQQPTYSLLPENSDEHILIEE
jgi:fibronectin type 3 domain-containing protein